MRRIWTAGGLAALAAALVAAPAAPAATQCVGGPDCPTLGEALTVAQDNGEPDLLQLVAGEIPSGGATYASAERLDVIGKGATATTIVGALRLDGERVVLRDVAIQAQPGPFALAASGRAIRVRLIGEGTDAGFVALAGAPLVLDDVAVQATGLGVALDAPCAILRARHVTVAGDGATGARAACNSGEASVELDSSIVTGGYPVGLAEGAGGEAIARYSNVAGTVAGTETEPVPGPPGFVSATDLRLAPGSPLIERGDPAPLVVDPSPDDRSEPVDDLGGDARVADGDGDGTARRDVGAFEAPPAPLGVPAGNLLINPDAEATGPGPVPGWQVAGPFATVAYGTMPFPPLRTGLALGGGGSFFAGGEGDEATATQVLDVAGSAASIDAGLARARLSGLLGGYRADADVPTVQATFRGPGGVTLGMLGLGPVDAAARSNATTLVARSATGPVPAFTRTIEVVLRARKGPSGQYDDAYFDNLGLTLDAPPPPGGGGEDGRPGDPPPGPRPFAGLVVLRGKATLSRARGSARLFVGCATATVARCSGQLALHAILVRGGPRLAIGRAGVSLAPGGTRWVAVRLSRSARSYLRRHTLLRVRVATTAVDGQGIWRATTVPIVVRPQRRPARRSGRR